MNPKDTPRSPSERAEKADTEAAALKKRLWDFLNSQFGLWLLGSVVLSLITYYWNHRNDQRLKDQQEQQAKLDRQREDSQFLATLLPYLTNKDAAIRLRAQDVILARYPQDQVPPQVQLLIANSVFRESSTPDAQQNDETKRLLTNVASTFAEVQVSTADKAIKSLLPTAIDGNKRQQISVNFYPKSVDRINFNDLSTSLSNAGFKVNQLSSGGKNPDLETNAIWAADDVSVEQAKFVALLLMQGGVQVRALRRFRSDAGGASRKPSTIEIGTDVAFLKVPPLTVQQVIDLNDIPRR